jgi:hypothetical protein
VAWLRTADLKAKLDELEAENDRLEFQLGEMIGRYSDLEAEIAALRAAQQWRPIAEALRVEDSEWVWLYGEFASKFDRDIGPTATRGKWDNQRGWWRDVFGLMFTPTHYMPIPAPPKEAA